MPAPKRPRREPTDAWEQLRLFVTSPEQQTYELLRPIVLFGQTPEERAATTATAAQTLRRKADRFDRDGMSSLFASAPPRTDDRRTLPLAIRQTIVDLKADYPAFRPHEIAAICRRRHECRVTHHTVQRVLAEGLPASLTARRYPPYEQISDPTERRLAIVRLFFEGWNIKSIALYLETTRTRVYETVHRWIDEGVRGMQDYSRAPKTPAHKVDLKALAAVKRLQANPELGEFRIHAALEQLGIHLSPRTCGRILAHHRALYALARPATAAPHQKTPMPFAAQRRHQYWSVDVRYIEDHQLANPKPVYVISILENYSRALLASVLSPRQDLTAYLIVLRAAIREHGCPEVLVSDSGSIFKAKQAQVIYTALGITKEQIDTGQPWQNYIETHFNVLRRMADYHFAQATTWGEMRAVHDRFFADYNYQAHWAHQDRADKKRSPADVLGWVHGAWCDDADLDRYFRLRTNRRIDSAGYVRYHRWRVYGERGLVGSPAAIWLFGETLTVEYGGDALAQYQVTYEPDARHMRGVQQARLFETRYPSPQPFLWDLGDLTWHTVQRLPPYHERRHPREEMRQERLFP